MRDQVQPDYKRAKRQMLTYLDDELFLGLESELEGIVDWNWLVRAVVDAAIGDGERVWWCAEHQHEGFDSEYEPGWVCESGSWLRGERRWDCRIVSKLLINPPTEEE